MARSAKTRIVDAEHPWLGLSRFTPETASFFFGRNREIRDIFLRVREFPLTVLYGQSGLGKSSLLGAGLIPKLKVEGFQPYWIRLLYGDADLPLLEQVAAQLKLPVAPANPTSGSGSAPPKRTLWEVFHHLPTRQTISSAGMPVLIFDQFEEIFTLPEAKQRDAEQYEEKPATRSRQPKAAEPEGGITFPASLEQLQARAAKARSEVEDFFQQIADLVENRPPAVLQARLLANRELAREYDFGPSPVRMVLTLREDYLSRLEAWKTTLPSLMRNRMELLLLNGVNALDAVVLPGRMGGQEIVSEEVGKRIVWFVAKRPAGTPLEEIGAVPPLLSLLCDELNELRLKDRAKAITADQVDNQSANILQNFCDRNFAGLHPAVRRFVEDRMVTRNGHRNAVDRAEAVEELKGYNVPNPDEALDQLVEERLLTGEERGRSWRLEITHDVLTPLLVRSRNERRTREAAERAKLEADAAAREAKARAREAEARARREAEEVAEKARREAEQVAERARVAEEAAARERRRVLQVTLLAMAILAVGVYAGWQALENAKNYKEAQAAKDIASAAATAASNLAESANAAKTLAQSLQQNSDETAEKLRIEKAKADAANQDLQTANKRIEENARNLEQEIAQKNAAFLKLEQTQKAQAAEKERAERLVREITRSSLSSAQALYAEGKWDDAVTQLSRAIQNDPEVTSAHVGLWTTLLYGKRNRSGLPVSSPAPAEGSNVRWAAFSHDGTRLATATFDTAQVWDISTAAPVGPPVSIPGSVRRVEFSRDDTKLLLVDATAIKVVGVPTASLLGEHLRPEGDITDARLGPEGTSVAFAFKNTAAIWNFARNKLINVKRGSIFSLIHRNKSEDVTSINYSPDGRLIVTTAGNNIAQLWNTTTGRQHAQPLRGSVTAEFSPDSSRVMTASNNEARVWNAGDGEGASETMSHDGLIYRILYSPDGARIVSASEDKARVWDATTGKLIGNPISHSSQVLEAAFSPDGLRIATSDLLGLTRIMDAAPPYPTAPVGENQFLVTLSFSPDGSQLLAISGSSTQACIWNAAVGRPAGLPLVHRGNVNEAKFNADGTRVITISEGFVRIWDASTGQPIGGPMGAQGTLTAEPSPDGKYLVTGSVDTLLLWDVSSNKLIRKIHDAREGALSGLHFSPDGSKVLVRDGSSLQICSVSSDEPAHALSIPELPIWDAVYTPDGRQIVVVTADFSVRMFNSDTLQQTAPGWKMPAAELGNVMISFVGSRPHVLRTAWNAPVTIWDVEAEKSKGEIRLDSNSVTASLSPDGNQLATFDLLSNSVQIWDCTTGRQIGVPLAHQGTVRSAAFSPDGRRIVTSGDDTTARIWEINGERLPPDLMEQIAQLCTGKAFDAKLLTSTDLDLDFRRAAWDGLQKNELLTHSKAWLALARTVFGPQPNSPVSPTATMTVRQAATALISTGVEGCIREAVAFDPGHPLAQIALAGFETNPARANFLRDFGLKRLPEDAALCRLAAQLLLDQGEKARAGQAFDKAAQLDPDHPDVQAIRTQLKP